MRIIYLFIVVLLCLPFFACQKTKLAPCLINLSTNKSKYLRYEIVEIQADLKEIPTRKGTALLAEVFHQDSLVESVAELKQVNLLYDSLSNKWQGYWPIPWNPPVGDYRIIVKAQIPGDTMEYSSSKNFEITSRETQKFPDGFCAMTIEHSGNFLKERFREPEGETKNLPAHPGRCAGMQSKRVGRSGREQTGWRNFTEWAKYLGADAIFYSVGWTIEGYPGTTDSTPWVAENLRVFSKLAEEAHKAGFKFGGYVGSFLLWGPWWHQLKYSYSYDYNKGRIFRNHHVSLNDTKRIADIVTLLKLLDRDTNIDYVGLDYIRPGPGGFEMVDEFVKYMSIPVPQDWKKWDKNKRMTWLAKKVKPVRKDLVRERWQWWLAHKTAETLAKILEIAKLQKPVWVFTLGWDKGHEHGQDPVMMSDAGADLNAVMLYESDAQQCRDMMKAWSTYLSGEEELQLIAGEEIDWPLLQETIAPPGPEEFYIRLTDGIKGMAKKNKTLKGLFWHDFTRANFGRRGPYSCKEWLIVGASAFSKVRAECQRVPLRTRIATPEGTSFKHPFEIELFVENLTDTTIRQLKAEWIKIPGIQVKPESLKIDSLLFRKIYPCKFQAKLSKGRAMLVFRSTWNSSFSQDQFFSFTYLPKTYEEQPFRYWKSVYSGGDVLIVGETHKKWVQEIGKKLRRLGFEVAFAPQIEEEALRKYETVVFSSNPGVLNPAEKEWLHQYLTEGGSILILDNGKIEYSGGRIAVLPITKISEQKLEQVMEGLRSRE
ncbi:MAG: hypothetical protein AB1393_08560 [Candidatus Edwardsbacteria bacterium]